MRKIISLILSLHCLAPCASAQGKQWAIQLEEPTGIERRDDEVVRLGATFAPNQVRPEQLRMIDPENREVPIQVAVSQKHPDGPIKSAEILFPATMIPGELPRYTLMALPQTTDQRRPGEHGGEYHTDIVIRRLGTSRLELGNSRFGIIVNLGKDGTTPAIVEAYNRTADDHRLLNLVETTPDIKEPLEFGVRSAGWGTTLEGAAYTSGFTSIEILESGPLRARVRMSGARIGRFAEEWEFEWYSQSPVLVWRTRTEAKAGTYGFFFSAISASPYEPFTHWVGGSETSWPDGWETDNPPHERIAAHTFDDLPGGHFVYYNPKENYGALDFFELDGALKWIGVGSPQFYAVKKVGASESQKERAGISTIKRPEILQAAAEWTSQMGICFPRWRSTETLLEARSDYRRFAQPILSYMLDPQPLAEQPDYILAPRSAVYRIGEEPISKETTADIDRADIVRFSLDGSWKLQGAEKGEGVKQRFFEPAFDDSDWRIVHVPGSVHTQILKYPAYFSHEAEWISFKEWWYRKRFRVPAGMKGKRIRLQFEATDYYADIWLNGEWLGRHEGYIDPYEFEVTDQLNFEGENTLAVRVWTPVHYYWRHRPYTIKGSYGAVDQKPDNITAVGITRSVRLIANGPVIIEGVLTRPSLNSDGSADVDVEVSLNAQFSRWLTARLELTLAPRNFDGDKRLTATADLSFPPGRSIQRINIRFHLDRPKLWWTWDHGQPNLYTLSTRVVIGDRLSDERAQVVGIREIEKVGWVFYLNGRRLYIRGTNSYYFELFMSEMNREKYERDIKLIRDMNINLIRLHCHFQNPEFYELCDEWGILVWQDYLEAWYPHDREFALKAARLYDPHIRMVRSHPCIAIWATSDEEDLENYRVLTKHLAGRLYANDPERRAVVRSTGRYGDAHVYHGWYGGSIWQYTKIEEKFISELGATALPDYESLIQFLPHHWPIEEHKEEWIFRKLQINEAMRAWGRPAGKTLQEYILHTQAYVARLHQLAIERMRRRKYAAGGILHFHAIDFWPSVTMAAVDYFRKPTKAYFTVQRSFQMVLASFEYDRNTWKVGADFSCGLWIINDHWYAIPGATIKWKIVNAQGAVAASGEITLDIAEDSSKKLEDLHWKPTRAGKFELRAEVFDKEGKLLSENIYEFEVIT